MWSSQKNIFNVLNSIFVEQKYELYPEFRSELRKNYDNFMKNKPPSADERNKVKNANKDQLQLFNGKITRTLQPALVEEALTLSDLFALSEISSVELLLEAEEQMPYFYGYNRGLTAILLYYDAKKIYLNNLRTLTLTRKGRTWEFDESISPEVTNMNTEFVDNLIQNGLITKILNQLEAYDWARTEEQLLRVNGLGNLKHRKEVKGLFEEIRTTLAECVYNCACQVPLSNTDVIAIINFLKKNAQYSNQNKNALDLTHVYLLMAVLYCFDCNFVGTKEGDNLDIIKPLTQNAGLKTLYNELIKNDSEEWTIHGVKSILQFAYHLFLTCLNSATTDKKTGFSLEFDGLKFEENQRLIDMAIDKRVFNLIKNLVIDNDRFHYEKYFVERIHNLLTDFICKMPEKIKDLKHKNEEYKGLEEFNQSNLSFQNEYQSAYHPAATTFSSFHTVTNQSQNRFATVANHDFEEFLNLLGDLYSKDPLKLELCLNYWSADNQSNIDMNYQNPSQKQISLYKFLRYFLSSDITSSSIYISYINLLTGLSTGEESAQHCYMFLQQNNLGDSRSLRISLQHIVSTFERYYDFFKLEQTQQTRQQANLTQSKAGLSKGMVHNELQGLVGVCRLLNQIMKHNEKIRLTLFEIQCGSDAYSSSQYASAYGDKLKYNSCSFSNLMFGLVTCPIPMLLKGEIFKILATLASTSQIAVNIWNLLESSQILQTVPVNFAAPSQFTKNDIKIELEEIEARDEVYPAIRGFLEFVSSLVQSSEIPDNLGLGFRSKDSILGFQPYLQFLIKSVYLKMFYRVYKNVKEKWEITNSLLHMFHHIISRFEINSPETTATLNANQYKYIVSTPGYNLLYEFTHDGSMLRTLFFILNETLLHLQEYNQRNDELIEQTALKCLRIISKVIQKQTQFVELLKLLKLNVENTGIDKFLISINPKTNRTDFLIMIFSFLKFNSILTRHTDYVLNIIIMLSDHKVFSTQHLNLFLKSFATPHDQSELVNSFVEIVEFDDLDETSPSAMIFKMFKDSIEEINSSVNGFEKSALLLLRRSDDEEVSNEELRSMCRLKALKILLFYIRLPAPNLSLLLLGMDIQKPLRNQSFYNPGTKISYENGANNNTNSADMLTIVPRNCLHSVIRILNKLLKEPTVLFSIPNSIDMAFELLNILCLNPLFNQQLLFYLRNEFDFVYKHLKQIPFKFNEYIEMELSQRNLNYKQSLVTLYSWIMSLTCIELQNLTATKNRTQLKRLIQLLIENIDDSASSVSVADRKFTKDGQDYFNFNNKIFNLLMNANFSEQSPDSLDLNYFDPQLIEKVIETYTFKPEFNPTLSLFDMRKIKDILFNEIGDSNANLSKINLINELKYILQIIFERNQFQYQFLCKKKFHESFKTLIEALLALTPVSIFTLGSRYTFIISLIEKLFEKLKTEDVFPELTYPVASMLFTLVKNLRDVIEQILRQRSLSDTKTQTHEFSNIPETFENLVDYLLNSNLTNISVRTYLYAAINNFLMIYDFKYSDSSDRDRSIEAEFGEGIILQKLNKSYSSLFKIICSDTCEGSLNLSTMMGYSVLNKILKFDIDQRWLKFINDNGYLACIVNTIASTDNQLLEELFHSESSNDKIIYVFESKLAFLLSISKTTAGAQYLLKNGLINKLTSCSIFSQRKNFERNISHSQYSYLTIQLLHHYYKVLFPVLKLLISILNLSGSKNILAKSEISKFVLKFSDSFVHILTSKQIDIQMLEELNLVTSLLCKLAPFDELIFDQTDSYLIIECNSAMARIKKEFNNLISLYFVPDQVKQLRKEIEKNSTEAASKQSGSHLVAIAINLATFLCANVKPKDLSWSSIIFDSIIDINETKNSIYNISSKNINLGLLISFIKFSIENLEKNFESESDLLSKQKNINQLSEIEKKQIIGDIKINETTENDKKIALANILKEKLQANKEDNKNLKFLIEKNLLLLWRHIEFYFRCFSNINTQDMELRNTKLSNEEFYRFRQNLNCALNQNFLKRLIDLNQQNNAPMKTTDFVGTIVKRIQRLMHLHSQ